MRVPSTAFIAAWLRHFAIFFCGVIVGFALLTAVEAHNYELIVLENHELQQKTADLQSALDEYIQTKDRKNVIKTITAVVLNADGKTMIDKIAQLALKQRIEHDLDAYKGMRINPDTLFEQLQLTKQLLYRKIYPNVNDKDYQVEMQNGAVVGGELRVWVTVKIYNGE